MPNHGWTQLISQCAQRSKEPIPISPQNHDVTISQTLHPTYHQNVPVFGQHNVKNTFVVIIDKPPDIFFSGMIRKLKKVNLKKYALVMICKLCIQKYTTFWKWVAFPFHGEAIVYQEHLATVAGEILKWPSIAYMVMIITMFNVQWTLRYRKFESLEHRFESTWPVSVGDLPIFNSIQVWERLTQCNFQDGCCCLCKYGPSW